MTGAEIVAAVLAAVSVLQGWSSARAQKSAVKRDAVIALSDAVTKTEHAIAHRGGPDVTDYELTNLWHVASLKFRDADEPTLSRLCQIKGNYWRDPANWTDAQLREAGISLRAMRRELQRILAE